MVGDVFVAAACVAYYGAFTSLYREKVRKSNSQNIPHFNKSVQTQNTLHIHNLDKLSQ